MQWWSAEGGRYNATSELKGSIDLASVHAVENVSYDAFTKAHMFQIVHSSLLYIQCNTKKECEEWVSTMRRLICNNVFLHPKYHPGYFDDKVKKASCRGGGQHYFAGKANTTILWWPCACGADGDTWACGMLQDKVWSCCGIPSRDFKGCIAAHDYHQLRKAHAAQSKTQRPAPLAIEFASAEPGAGQLSPEEHPSAFESGDAFPTAAPVLENTSTEALPEASREPPQVPVSPLVVPLPCPALPCRTAPPARILDSKGARVFPLIRRRC
jgi:hypothetical protein